MRRILVSRSSREKPRPLLRLVRTSSPSSSSTVSPRARSSGTSARESVDLPAPESPVNQTVKPVNALLLGRVSELRGMQAALDLVRAAPASGARVVARVDRSCAVGAADARIALVVQRV